MTANPKGAEAERLGPQREASARHLCFADSPAVKVEGGRQQGVTFKLGGNGAKYLKSEPEQGRPAKAQFVQSRPTRTPPLEAG